MNQFTVEGLVGRDRKTWVCMARNEFHAASKAKRKGFWWISSVTEAVGGMTSRIVDMNDVVATLVRGDAQRWAEISARLPMRSRVIGAAMRITEPFGPVEDRKVRFAALLDRVEQVIAVDDLRPVRVTAVTPHDDASYFACDLVKR